MRINHCITANLQNSFSFNRSANKAFNTRVIEIITRNKYDTLTISEQGLRQTKLRNLKQAEGSQTDDPKFLKVVTNIVSSTLSHLKSKIEYTLDYYSSYQDKIESGELDQQVSFDEYAEAMEKSKQSIAMDQTGIGKESGKENTAVSISTDEMNRLKNQAFDQLQDRISKLISKAAKNLDELFQNTKSTSKELSGMIEEIKGVTARFFSEEPGFDDCRNESDFTAAIQMTLENIDKTIRTVNQYSENQ